WREYQFARVTVRNHFAAGWINYLHDSEIGVKMITSRRLVVREWTFPPGHFRFSETIRADDLDVAGAEFTREATEFSAHSLWNLFTPEHDATKIFTAIARLNGLMQDVVNERRHAIDNLRFDFAEKTELAFGSHYFASACARHENPKSHAPVMGEPESQMRCIREHVQHAKLRLGATDLEEALPGNGKIVQIMGGKQEWNG